MWIYCLIEHLVFTFLFLIIIASSELIWNWPWVSVEDLQEQGCAILARLPLHETAFFLCRRGAINLTDRSLSSPSVSTTYWVSWVQRPTTCSMCFSTWQCASFTCASADCSWTARPAWLPHCCSPSTLSTQRLWVKHTVMQFVACETRLYRGAYIPIRVYCYIWRWWFSCVDFGML